MKKDRTFPICHVSFRIATLQEIAAYRQGLHSVVRQSRAVLFESPCWVASLPKKKDLLEYLMLIISTSASAGVVLSQLHLFVYRGYWPKASRVNEPPSAAFYLGEATLESKWSSREPRRTFIVEFIPMLQHTRQQTPNTIETRDDNFFQFFSTRWPKTTNPPPNTKHPQRA